MLPQFHLPNWFIFRSVFRMQTLTKIYTYCISLCFLEEKMDKVKKCWVCQSHFIWKTLFLWHFTSSLVLTLSMPSLPHSSLNFEGRVLMETPQLGLSVLMSLIFAHCPEVGLHVSCHLLSGESALMMTDVRI